MFNRPTLYHYPASLSSQIARLALVEKGVRWKSRIVDVARSHENYKPWYLLLNSGGAVPTLVHKNVPLTDCINIALYANNHFPGPALYPARARERELMEQLVNLQQHYPVKELSYGVLEGRARRRAHADLERHKKMLEDLAKKNKESEDFYVRKCEEVQRLSSRMEDQDYKQDIVNRLHEILDVLDQASSRQEWLAGPEYSLADIVWTAFLARIEFLGLAPLWENGRRPNLEAYYEKVKARKSFRKARIYARRPRWLALRVFLARHRTMTLIVLLLVVAAAAGALAVLSGYL